ncbi:PhzF family phenazine biosynthesis protein, partial [Vibrio parahaemolyticus]|nr:PhzF family phenazine biosynthesis protein [Vibrio parahaemolyticus]
IGGVYILADEGYVENLNNGTKTILLKTNIGTITAEIMFSNFKPISVVMEQGKPQYYGDIKDLSRIKEILNLDEDDIGLAGESVYPQIISTGLKDIICPIKSKIKLEKIDVDFNKLKDYSIELGVVGLHAFCLDKKDRTKAYARNFAPAVGINEEAATGTANGALIYYLKNNK